MGVIDSNGTGVGIASTGGTGGGVGGGVGAVGGTIAGSPESEGFGGGGGRSVMRRPFAG